MGYRYLPDDQIPQVLTDLMNVHFTFTDEIQIVLDTKKTLVSQNENYNFAFGEQPAVQETVTTVTKTILAKMTYLKYAKNREDRRIGQDETETRMDIEKILVKLNILPKDIEDVKQARHFIFDNRTFRRVSDIDAKAFLGTNIYYVIHVEAID